MKRKKILLTVIWGLFIAVLLLSTLSFAEEDHPIRMSIAADPETEMESGGTMPFLTFTLYNDSDTAYTLHDAKLSGGYDDAERPLNGEMTIDAHGKREFILHDVAIADQQLDTDILYTLTWTEITEIPAEPSVETTEADSQTEWETEPEYETELATEPAPTPASEIVRTERSTSAVIRVERFVLPELTITATAAQPMVAAGETFTVVYRVANETKYDITNITLTDEAYTGNIPLPGTELTAGAAVTVPIEYTMGESDMVFQPTATYIAAQRQTSTTCKEVLTVGAVVIGIRIDVQQYPSNEDGTTFAITITNTGNRAMKQLQLYDEINTQIDKPFDLAAQQQKVLTFNVPSAYSAGLVRTVRFRLTGKDYFEDDFTFVDANSYDCIPYVTSDAVRLSLLATVADAYYDENGNLCGVIQFEIRNYSDVRITDAVLSELTVFGTVTAFDELQRGETFYQTVYQVDGIPSVSFRVTAKDTTGQNYQTETISLNLEQLSTLAERTENNTIIYHSNTFLQDLSDKIRETFRNGLGVAMILILISAILCLILWGIESHLRSKLPQQSLLSIRVPKTQKTAQTAVDTVLAGSPADQLGYKVPAKLRYTGAENIKKRAAEKEDSSVFAPIKRKIDEYWANPDSADDGYRAHRPASTFAAFLAAEKEKLASSSDEAFASMNPGPAVSVSESAENPTSTSDMENEFVSDNVKNDEPSAEQTEDWAEASATNEPVETQNDESVMIEARETVENTIPEPVEVVEPESLEPEIKKETDPSVLETAFESERSNVFVDETYSELPAEKECVIEEDAPSEIHDAVEFDKEPITLSTGTVLAEQADIDPEAAAVTTAVEQMDASDADKNDEKSVSEQIVEEIEPALSETEEIETTEETIAPIEASTITAEQAPDQTEQAVASISARTLRILELTPQNRRRPMRPNRIVHIG